MSRIAHGTPRRRMVTFVLGLALWSAAGLAWAQEVEVRPWSELLVVVGRDVGIALPDAYVEGKALGVTQNALVMDVKQTTDARAYPKGRVTLSRSLVSVLRLRRYEDQSVEIAAPMLSQAGALGLYSARQRTGPMLRNAGAGLGVAALGWVIGKRMDRREIETIIRVAPEPGDTAVSASTDGKQDPAAGG